MRICIVYKEEFPWDVRVEKIAVSLASDGHSVTVVARNNRGEKTEDTFANCRIVRLPRGGRFSNALRKAINAAYFFNPFWLRAIWRASCPGGVIVVRDLPLGLAAVMVGRVRGCRVILDMAECYPEMYASVQKYEPQSLIQRVVKSPLLAAYYEKVVLKRVDHVLVMIEESRDRLLAMGVESAKISIVSNTPVLPSTTPVSKAHEGRALRIVYVGFVTRLRGLDLLLRGIALLRERQGPHCDVCVDVIGIGAATTELLNLTVRLGLEDVVRIHGWQDAERVREIMETANVGALTYRQCGHWNHTIPNKIFDYMLAGLPVLATDVRPIARLLRGAGAGIVVAEGTADDVASGLAQLQDPELRSALGSNGQSAVYGTYNWPNELVRLRRAVENAS